MSDTAPPDVLPGISASTAPPLQIRVASETRGAVPGGVVWQRLSGGRTNRVWKISADTPLVVKLYEAAAASPLFPNRSDHEAAALTLAAPQGLAPRLRDSFVTPAGDCLVYELAHGRVWRSGTAAVARALYRVHCLPPPDALPEKPAGEAALRAEIHEILSGMDDAQARGILHRLERLGSAQTYPAPSPVFRHGDPVPGNIIRRGQRLMLIDWQCAGRGDAADDLALFLSPAMQRLYRGRPLSSWEVAAFLAAYPDAQTVARYLALKPLFHLRMAAHCLWKARRGDSGYGRALMLELGAAGA